MDPFYAAPRQPPVPPTIRPFERIPAVPEVSIIDNSAFPRPPSTHCHPPMLSERLNELKHVRFKGPLCGKENVPETLKTVPNLKGKTFKQIYMANVPDRHLDLSLFEPVPAKNDLMTEVLGDQPNTAVLSSPKYRDSPPIVFRTNSEKTVSSKALKYSEICTQTDPPSTEIATVSDEPTIKDLFKIIQQQNKQIMLLQKQVDSLKTNVRQPEIDAPPFAAADSPSKKGLFSFDVKATSFEFSFRPPQQKYRKNDFLEPRIQELVEPESSSNVLNNSLHLEQSLEMKDSYLSNPPSIAIEMENYHSSDEEDPEIGPTFYKDLMKQVNNALKRAQKQSECPADLKGQTMRAVKQATLQHLKTMGVNLAPIQESSEVTKGSDVESEVSCAVQQLLMKYLPSDKLPKVVTRPEAPPKLQTEFSFATLQYMKKYNLIDNRNNAPGAAPRILDVTALKRQPKLL